MCTRWPPPKAGRLADKPHPSLYAIVYCQPRATVSRAPAALDAQLRGIHTVELTGAQIAQELASRQLRRRPTVRLIDRSFSWRAWGAGVLFAKVARHETRPLTARRFGLWLASLWLWPLLILRPAGREKEP